MERNKKTKRKNLSNCGGAFSLWLSSSGGFEALVSPPKVSPLTLLHIFIKNNTLTKETVKRTGFSKNGFCEEKQKGKWLCQKRKDHFPNDHTRDTSRTKTKKRIKEIVKEKKKKLPHNFLGENEPKKNSQQKRKIKNQEASFSLVSFSQRLQ